MLSTARKNQVADAFYSFLFGREMFEKLLAVPNCAGIVVFKGQIIKR
jgi:hypothetical protein